MEELVNDIKAGMEAILADIDKLDNKPLRHVSARPPSSSRNSARFTARRPARSKK